MRFIAALVVLVSFSYGQWVETIIQLPDTLYELDSICAVQFHSPNRTVYLGGNHKLVAVDAGTHEKLTRTAFSGVFSLMCSSTGSNKLYCTSVDQESVWVLDCATNQFLATVPLGGQPRALCYAASANKVYVACPPDNAVNVIDCGTDSVVARIDVSSWSSALCYSPKLNRVYSVQSASDEVTVIDCATDTVIRTIWVRGVKPTAVCCDSATNCVYTLNYTSGTLSVIDCAGDSLVRVVTVGPRPDRILAGLEGKIYCGGYADSVVTVVESSATRTIPVGQHLSSMSLDPVNKKVYCATSSSKVAVVDAIGDTIRARVGAGEDLRFVCYNPVDTSTWAVGTREATVRVIDGEANQLTGMLWFRVFNPVALCYNPVNDRLYCLGQGLAVIDCDSNRVLNILRAGRAEDSILWNPANNKIYFSDPADNTVSILDCAGDSIATTVQTGDGPGAMCCSDDGKVYVTTSAGGVAVIDPGGDSIRAVVPTAYAPVTLCYDRADNKVYAGLGNAGLVGVIDVAGDSVVATVPVAVSCDRVIWNQSHDKVYVWVHDGPSVVVIDCAGDTVLKSLDVDGPVWTSYSDSTCDKVYASANGNKLCIIDAATDSFYRSLDLWGVHSILDNGLPGAANRLYCADGYRNVNVVSGATDSTLRVIQLAVGTTALAWNPAHSRVYVSSHGSSSIVVVSDTMLGIGIEEGQLQAPSYKPQATIVRGELFMTGARDEGQGTRDELLDVSGRKVIDLHAGANDVSALVPGVYFIRTVGREPSATCSLKVVITK